MSLPYNFITRSNPRAHVCCIPNPSICSLDLPHGWKPVETLWDGILNTWNLSGISHCFWCNVSQSCNVNQPSKKWEKQEKENPKQANQKPLPYLKWNVLFSLSHLFILTYSVSMPMEQQVLRHQSENLANTEMSDNALLAICPCRCHVISHELVIIKLTTWP